MGVELFIAQKYLRAKRKEGFISLITFLSVAGVTVGVMALVVVIAVMSGAETEFRKKILGLEPHMLIMSYSGSFTPTGNTPLETAPKSKEITDVCPILFGQAMIRTKRNFSGTMIRGIDPSSGARLIQGFDAEKLEKAFARGSTQTALPGVILGRDLANTAGVIEGDVVLLMSSSGLASPLGQIPSMKRFEVRGIFSTGMAEYDSILAYVSLEEAQKLMAAPGKISAWGIWVADVFDVKKIRESHFAGLGYPFYIRDWMDINQSIFSALKLEKTAMFIILTLIILVAAFNIASTLIMMVMEKTKDIAVLKAMGASHTIIRRIFVIKGMIIGLLGTFLGTVAGVVACTLLKKYDFIQLPSAYPFSTLPVQLEWSDVAITAGAAVLICFLSTLYPSFKASRMDPVEAIRYG